MTAHPHHRRRSGTVRSAGERGTGVLSSIAGVAAFLVFLLFGVQLLANLYAVSTVSAAGLDAARTVASKNVDHSDPGSIRAAQASAEAQFHSLLGAAADGAELHWSVDGSTVRLQVIVDAPIILPPSLGDELAFSRIDRTFEVHVEELG